MSGRRSSGASRDEAPSSAFPMDRATWATVAKQLELSPQQTRIVELLLHGRQDKEIAAEMGLGVPTVRTYLKRIFDRVEVADRLALVLRIFAIAQEACSSVSCRCCRCRHQQRHPS